MKWEEKAIFHRKLAFVALLWQYNLLVILFKSSKILPRLGELSLLHALAHVPAQWTLSAPALASSSWSLHPTHQWTKALLAYIRSNLWSSLERISLYLEKQRLCSPGPGLGDGGGVGEHADRSEQQQYQWLWSHSLVLVKTDKASLKQQNYIATAW